MKRVNIGVSVQRVQLTYTFNATVIEHPKFVTDAMRKNKKGKHMSE
jgi:hypothetical protein